MSRVFSEYFYLFLLFCGKLLQFSQHSVPENFHRPHSSDAVVQLRAPDVEFYVIGSVTGEKFSVRFFKKNLLRTADEGLPVALAHLRGYGNGSATARLLDVVAQLAGHFVRRCAGTAGVVKVSSFTSNPITLMSCKL